MSYDLGTAHGKIELEYTGRSHESVDAAQKDMDGLGKNSKKTDAQLKKFGKTLSGIAGTAGKFGAIGFAFLQAGAAIGSASIQLLGMASQLASLASLAAAVPGAIVGIAAGVGVLKASFAGLDKVFAAAFDPEKAKDFDKAIKNLPSNAKAFAVALKAAAPALTNVQKGIQQAFFSTNLQSLFPAVIKGVRSLQGNLNGLAVQFSGIAKEVVGFATSAQSIDFVRASIDKFRGVVQSVSPTLVPILEGLRAVGRVGLPLFDSLGGALAAVGTKFADFLTAIASDGRLQGWIAEALQTLGELGALVRNIGSIFTSVLGAAQDVGGGLLNTLGEITGQLAAFLQSAQGGEAIRTLFAGIMQVASQLAPIITTLVGAVANGLGPALATIASTVGPALTSALQAIAPAFGPLVQGVADLIGAIAPLLVPIGSLIGLLATALGPALGAIAREIGPLVGLLGSTLASAINTLIPVVQQMVEGGLVRAADLGLQLAQAFAPLAPVILQFASSLATSLLPQLPRLVELSAQLVPAVVQLASAFSGILIQALTAIIPYLPQIVSLLVTVVGAMANVNIAVIQTAAALINFASGVASFVTGVGSFLAGLPAIFGNAIQGAYNFVVNFGTQIVGFFTALPGRLLAAISSLATTLPSTIGNAIRAAAFAFGAGIGIIITQAVALPGRVVGAISSLVSAIGSVVRTAWSAASSAFLSGVTSAVAIARALPGRAASAIASLVSSLPSIARNAWNSLRSAFSSGVASAIAVAQALPGRIRSALGNLGGLLLGAGRDVVMGLVNGIKGAIGSAVSAAASVGKAVISGIKSTLKISSPSKVMIQLGQFINQGLVKGLLGTANQVQAASNKVANAVNDAFRAKLISGNQRQSALTVLRKNTSSLLSLVGQSNAVAAKLKLAQASLKDIQNSYLKAQADASQKVKDSFALVTPGANFVNLDVLQKKLVDTVSVAQDFAKNIQTLTKRGLDKELLGQLADAGAKDGNVVAKALANASDEQLKAFNTLSGQLTSASNTVGTAVADSLFGAGMRAAQGLVQGLQSQQKQIEQVMANIANRIAGTLKKALKIKSPSRIMYDIGQFISEGLLDGIGSLEGRVRAAANSLAQSAIAPALDSSRRSNLSIGSSSGSVFAAVPGVGSGLTVNQTVNALPGMSATQLATYSATKLQLALKTGVNAVSLPVPVPQGA